MTVETVPSFNFVYVALSARGEGQPRQADPKVREAIALAIDYDGIIDFTVGGAGKRQASPIPNGFPGTAGLPSRSPGSREGQGADGRGGRSPTASRSTPIFPNVNSVRRRFLAMMQKVQQDLARDQHRARAAAGRVLGLARARQRRRHPAHGRLLRAGLLRLGPVRAVFRHDGGHAPGPSAPAPRPTRRSLNPKEAELLKQALGGGGEESAKHFAELGRR